jgi:hypothetical protein
MLSELATRYKSVKNLVARSKAAGKFQVGDPVRVLPSHGFAHYRGDTGVIDKMVPINKAYVESEKNGRIIVDLDDLEKIGTRTAALDADVKEAVFAFLRESKFGTLSLSMGAAAKKEGLNLGLRDVAKVLKAWFADKEPSDDKEESGFKYLKSSAGQKLFMGLVEGVTKVLRKEGARTGFKDVGEALVAFAEDK